MNLDEKRVLHSSPSIPASERKKFLRLLHVKRKIGLSRTTIYRMIAAGDFPRPIRLGSRAVAWIEADVIQWMNKRERLSREGKQTG